MPRALVRAGALLASLLAVALVFVPAASAAGAVQKQRHVDIQMRIGAFRIDLYGSEQDGKQSATLYVARRDQFAEYIAPAELTESTIKAKFGALGEIDYSFAPKNSADAKCFGVEGGEAAFTGTFTFTGENDFVHFDQGNAAGFYYTYPEPPGCAPIREDRRATASRAAAEQPYAGDGATLTASTFAKPKKGGRRLRALEVIGDGSSGKAGVNAVVAEGDKTLAIVRGVEVAAPRGAFEWDLNAGTAALQRFPAPFSGSARLIPRAEANGRLVGSLQVKILGERKPVRMAGGTFNGKLHHGTPPSP
jgi:hypothetical protein